MDDFNKSLYERLKTKSRYCVYFVECNNVFKIGTTSDIKSRLSTLQTSSPSPMRLVHTIPILIMDNHGEVERALHTIFESAFIRGEWYKITEQDIERIKLLSIDDIINIAQKMREIKRKNSPTKPKNQMTFLDDENT